MHTSSSNKVVGNALKETRNALMNWEVEVRCHWQNSSYRNIHGFHFNWKYCIVILSLQLIQAFIPPEFTYRQWRRPPSFYHFFGKKKQADNLLETEYKQTTFHTATKYTLGPPCNEFGYNEYLATTSRFICIKIIDCSV